MTIRSPEKVVDITPSKQRSSVKLESGEVVEGDVVVCADGCIAVGWLGRRLQLEALEEKDEVEPTGMKLFKCAPLYPSHQLYVTLTTAGRAAYLCQRNL